LATIKRRDPAAIEADIIAGGGIYHPGGSTRMSDSARAGVVDRQLKVFGVPNVRAVSTAILPAGGGSNPTMMLLMLGLRCADDICATLTPSKSRQKDKRRDPSTLLGEPRENIEVIGDLSLKAGGPPVTVISNGSALASLGHEVIVATTDANGEQIDLGSRTSKVPPTFTFRHWPPQKFVASPGLTKFLWNSIPTFDVVIIHGFYHYATMIASHICMHFKVPYVLEPHGVLDPFMYKRHRFRKTVTEILFQNRATRNAAAIWFSSDEGSSTFEAVHSRRAMVRGPAHS